MTAAGEPLYVVVANAPYDDPIATSKQHVAAAIARRFRTLYVEPPPLTIDPVAKPREFNRYLDFRKGIRGGAERLRIVCPPPFRQALDTRFPAVDALNQALLGRFIARAVESIPHDSLTLISFVYNAAGVARRLRPDRFVYYCVDLMAELRIPYSKPETVRRIERETIDAADLVVAPSARLRDHLSRFTDRVQYLPHGVDFELFARATAPGDVPADLAAIPGPRIGFVGVLAHWIDVDLLIRVARTRRDWSLVLIGPVGPHADASPLAREPNVHLLGTRGRSVLPDYLRGMDAAVVPFLRNDLTDHANPLKALEYLAAGLPVVSTAVPEIVTLGNVVRIAESPDAFASALAEAIDDRDEGARSRAMDVARASDWSARVDSLFTMIASLPKPR